MNQEIKIRKLRENDCANIVSAFEIQGWNQKLSHFQNYLDEQKKKKRDVLIATSNDEFLGYLTIVWNSNYPPFRETAIPEIVDFNVLDKYQKHGVGSKLLDAAENAIKKVSEYAGIGVGLFPDYGNAQRLYVKRGYIPDGLGIYKEGCHPQFGDIVTVDDALALYFTKKLR